MARPVEVVFWIDGVEELSAGREKAGYVGKPKRVWIVWYVRGLVASRYLQATATLSPQ